MRNKNSKALKGDLKLSPTKEIVGKDIELCIKWIRYQLCLEINWSKIPIDHIEPISFVVSRGED